MRSSVALPALEQQYRLESPVGYGESSTVYQAVDLRGNIVAVKVFDQRLQRDVAFVANFRREARLACRLDHPNVLKTLNYGFADEHFYLVTEYLSQGNLTRLLPEPHQMRADAVQALIESCSGVEYVHQQGIVHRNLKPANILIGEDQRAVVSGAGPARRVAASGLTVTGTAVEAVAFMSPEQIVGGDVTPASDVYALGVMLYLACTGTVPFDARSPIAVALKQVDESPTPPRERNPEVTAELEAVILRCLEKDGTRRYARASDLQEALRNAAEPALQKTTYIFGLSEQAGVEPGPPMRMREKAANHVRALLARLKDAYARMRRQARKR